jgi:XTP/dITP diphosphohydrolase
MTRRVILLVTSPRMPAGLLTAAAWDVVRSHPVLAAAHDATVAAMIAAGVSVTIVEPTAQSLLDAAAEHDTVVWLAGPGGDEELARELGNRLVREPTLAQLEVLVGSWDPPGARLLDAVTVMDRLLAPGGDPWLSQYSAAGAEVSQSHGRLAPYLIEEAYEAYDAISAGDLHALREELGDVLLQVVLHARLGADAAEGDEFDIDDVAGDLVEKLIRRNPHVFADHVVDGVDAIVANWEQIKHTEKSRESVLDGIALSQPALSLAAKVLSRVERSGLSASLPGPGGPSDPEVEAVGLELLGVVAAAQARGVDAEGALRQTVLAFADEVRRVERAAS